ncbi:hypothetical protein [Streptomyces phaeochromogenes]|uniref:hypothetical protein n=1 Tax=Streptomyces phaeochromogenes TaxID=1923 RepID=UPI002DD8E9F3|nr:hypothetical protein [Streptomyces phaeochromogenes]WRZ34538.1 hypothetical protein OG931_45800 [Streptomyces phaeochromogenes]
MSTTPSNPAKPSKPEDFPGLVGEEFVGDWFTQSPERQQQFYLGTYLDETYGESMDQAYPEGLVEGFNQLGLLDYLSAEIIGRWHGYNYGLDRVRFLTPLTVRDRIRLRLRVETVAERGNGFLVKYDTTLEIEENPKPAMIAQWLVLLLPVHSL